MPIGKVRQIHIPSVDIKVHTVETAPWYHDDQGRIVYTSVKVRDNNDRLVGYALCRMGNDSRELQDAMEEFNSDFNDPIGML